MVTAVGGARAAGLRFTVASARGVAVRRQPSVNGALLATLEQGDEFIASDVSVVEGVEWARLEKVSGTAEGRGSGRAALDLSGDAFVPTEDPSEGPLLQKHAAGAAAAAALQQDGVLSRAEINEILAGSSDPTMPLPLEAKYWSRQELQMFVLSAGVIRPRDCSIPDERLMANTDMSQEDVAQSLAQASEWLGNADALFIGSGAGMGVDSGLGTFRGGHQGVWKGLEEVGLAYEDICDAKWFVEDPHLAWAFWDHCYKAYQGATPHDGYASIREWGLRCPLGFFSFTSNIDGHWISSGVGADRVLEVHGAVRWLQCSKPCCPDVWRAPKDHGLSMLPTNRVGGALPVCPKCKAVARPNVQMFGGDSGFSKARRVSQFGKYDGWLKELEARPDKDSLRIACLEVGCGLTVPTVRKELEAVMRKFPQARLIRVNPENPGISQELAHRGVSLPLPARVAIDELRRRMDAAQEKVTYLLWGQSGGCELRAPYTSSLGRLLRLANAEEGVEVAAARDTKAVWQDMLGRHEEIKQDSVVPVVCFKEVKRPDGSEAEMCTSVVLNCAIKNARRDDGLNEPLARRVDEVRRMLDDMNELFGEQGYQDEVRRCVDKRGVMKIVRSVHYQVLPKYGFEASERGTMAMTHFISSVQLLPDVQEKVERSMRLSFISHMGHLPSAAPASASGGRAADGPPAAPPLAQPAAAAEARAEEASLWISLTSLASDGSEVETARAESTTAASVADLRRSLSRLWGWEEEAAERTRFCVRQQGSLCDLADGELVRQALFVRGADGALPPPLRLRRPAEQVEILFFDMATASGEAGGEKATPFRYAVMSDCTIADLRGKLATALGWDEDEQKRARFVKKMSTGFGTLKEHERVEGRRTIYVHGVPLVPRASAGAQPVLEDAAPAAAPAAALAAAVARPGAGAPAAPSARRGATAPAPDAAAPSAAAPKAAPGRAVAAAEEVTWVQCKHCDIDLPLVDSMDASDLAKVKQRCEVRGFSGFSVWQGRAYLKNAGRPLRREELQFKGAAVPVEFHLLVRAKSMKLDTALRLQEELIAGFSSADFQHRMQKLRSTAVGAKLNGERLKLLLSVQGHVLPRYGFEGSLQGVMEMMEAFGAPHLQASQELQANGARLEALIAQ